MVLRTRRKQGGRTRHVHLLRVLSRLSLLSLGHVAVLGSCACASSTPAPQSTEKPLYIGGIRQRPLTVDEAASMVGSRSTELSRCYGRERVNLDASRLSDYVFQLQIPTDGTKPAVTVQKATDPKQKMLESCLMTVLASTRFPAHVGKPLTINVPIEAPQ
ncbi:MAG: hypothetical protein IPK13_14550 [Deltaproteobacteria bacterium]|nr:hypothetical protein [Deltaproteobacteria bacterium]